MISQTTWASFREAWPTLDGHAFAMRAFHEGNWPSEAIVATNRLKAVLEQGSLCCKRPSDTVPPTGEKWSIKLSGLRAARRE